MDLEWLFCPECQYMTQFLVEKENHDEMIIRLEQCINCGNIFESEQKIENELLETSMVVI